ncbi:hypothetical protein BJ166DRAFT_116354 [Pestalotiopsis sp. NC0098]|nr:hypothetical protein BJ166DRAFT_116354 [Pestalotiopsis sp. NC0098]
MLDRNGVSQLPTILESPMHPTSKKYGNAMKDQEHLSRPAEPSDDSGHVKVLSAPTYGVNRTYLKLEDNVPWCSLIPLFEKAISNQDFGTVVDLLHESYDRVARGKFAWIDDLRQLGLSLDEIAEELLDKASDSPWIHSIFRLPSHPSFDPEFHVRSCLCGDNHAASGDGGSLPQSNQPADLELSVKLGTEDLVKETIDLSCGIGGVRPSGRKRKCLQFGFVEFVDQSIAVVSTANQTSRATLARVLDSLLIAAGCLQQAGGCCHKFTFLSTGNSAVELHSLDLGVIHDLKGMIDCPRIEDMSNLIPGLSFGGNVDGDTPDAEWLLYILVQFLSTALLSYSQAHCGPLQPVFLDRGIERIMLTGAPEWVVGDDGPCIVGSLVDLACFGDMLGQPALAFQYFPRRSQAESFTRSEVKYDLIASPHDLIDTWGPGQLITSSDNHDILHAIYLGGGCITATGENESQTVLHWSREPRLAEIPKFSFSRYQKATIGAQVSVNQKCTARQRDPLRSASVFLHELGTYRDYWESTERQLGFGLQAGQSAIAALQLNQTWIKMKGMTKKSRMLAQLYKTDLEELHSVQVSVCTGVARRVSLRKMLADLLPTYIAALVSEPPLWKSLVEDFDIIAALQGDDLGQWAAKLPHDHQRTFESLLIAILTLMRDTGIDNKGENFVIGCIQPEMAFQCFQVPCTKENYWTRMLTDSDEVATFAYITMDCLETSQLKCRGPGSPWANSTGLFWTAVACCERQIESGVSPAESHWELRHSEAYIIGAIDAPLLVKVDRPNRTLNHDFSCLSVGSKQKL